MRRCLAAAFAAAIVMPTIALADDEEEEGSEESKGEDKDAKSEKADKKDGDGEASDAAESAGELTASGTPSGRMTMPGGKVLINGIVEVNLSKGASAKPLSLAPDIWYGASDKLTLGLVHSGRGAVGFLTGAGRGLCFNGGGGGGGGGTGMGGGGGVCGIGLGKVYTSVGAEARIGLTEGGFPFALAIGGFIEGFKPKLIASAKIGAIGRWQSEKVALELAPSILVGITQRKTKTVVNEVEVTTSINEDQLSLPVTLFYKLSPAFAIAAQTGVSLILEHAGDTYAVPVALGFAWWVSPKFSFDLAFGLAAVVDKNDMTKPFDSRSISLGVGYGM